MEIRTNSRGPGYSDVAATLIEFYCKWGGSWEFRLSADRDRKGDARLFVVLVRRRTDGNEKLGQEVRKWSTFPGPYGGSFASLLHGLCYAMDAELERRKLEAQAQTGF